MSKLLQVLKASVYNSKSYIQIPAVYSLLDKIPTSKFQAQVPE